MKQAFSNTPVAQMIAKITVPWVILLTYSCAFATSYWVEVSDASHHWGLWAFCTKQLNNTHVSEACQYWDFGDSDGYFEAARFLTPLPLLCYVALLFQISLMDLASSRGQIGPLVAYVGAFINILVLITVGSGYRNDSHWGDKNPSLSWSFWCAVPSAVVAILNGLAMSYAAHKRRYPNGKRSPHRRKPTKTDPTESIAVVARESAPVAGKIGECKSVEHERGCEEDADVWTAGEAMVPLPRLNNGRRAPRTVLPRGRESDERGRAGDGQKAGPVRQTSLKPIRGGKKQSTPQIIISQIEAEAPEAGNELKPQEANIISMNGQRIGQERTTTSMIRDKRNMVKNTEGASKRAVPRLGWVDEETHVNVSKGNTLDCEESDINSEDDERGYDKADENPMSQQQQRFENHLNEVYCMQEINELLVD